MPDQHMQDDEDGQINTQPNLTPAGEELDQPQDYAQTGHTEAPSPADLQRGVWHSFGFQPRDPDPQTTLGGQQDAYLPSPLPSAAANQPPLPKTAVIPEEIEMGAPPPTFEASPREGERTVLGGPGPSHESSDRGLTQQEHATEGEEKQTESSVGPDRSSRGRGKRGRGRPRSNDITRYPRPPRSSPRLAEHAQGLQLQLGSVSALEGGEDSPFATVTRTSPRQQTHLDVPPHRAGEGTNARYHPYSQPSTPFTSTFPSTSTPSRFTHSKAPQTPNTPSTPSLSHSHSNSPTTPGSLVRRQGLDQGYCLEEAKGLRDEVSPIKSSGSPGFGWGPSGSGGRRRRMGMSRGMGTGTGVGMGSSPGVRMTSMDFGAAIPPRPSMTTSELPPLNPAAKSPSSGGNVGDVGALIGGQEKGMEGTDDSEMGEEPTSSAPPTFIENPLVSHNTAQAVEDPPSPRSRAIKEGDEEEKEDGEDGGPSTMSSELHLKEDDSKP
ncbi:hypothetical protein I350_03169 [Cryptococcus amylolentus CBS 6273]|uniref:Uncharacterized protein n=1 Tax=Cryptococcus amylolentus CBS 6273 TaxID=1296118 RepID=A0A1E3K9D7_9TREE|nr:hypothetical protein I350_03169 [Cryptococcus amylolentus CBS 6273]